MDFPASLKGLTSIGGIGGIAILSMIPFIVSIWRQIMEFSKRVKRYFLVEVEICDPKSVSGLRKFLSTEFVVTTGERHSFSRVKCFSSKDDSVAYPLLRNLPEKGLLRRGVRFIWISDNYEDRWCPAQPKIVFVRWTFSPRYFPDNAYRHSLGLFHERRYRIEEIRGSRCNPNELMMQEKKEDSKKNFQQGLIKIAESKVLDGTAEDYIASLNKVADIYQVPENCEIIIDEIRQWLSMSSWYRSKGIAWKKGVLVHSGPGQGKTSLVRHVSMKLDMPLFSFDLASMTNVDILKAWTDKVGNDTPCVVLMEDFDAIFNLRENITNKDGTVAGLTFDCLLRCIDGINTNDGILLFITTNDITKIDQALSCSTEHGVIESRPGRIDRTVLIGNPSDKAKLNIATRILDGDAGLVEEAMREGKNDTGAQWQERCIRLVMREFNKKRTGVTVTQPVVECRTGEAIEVQVNVAANV